MCFSNTINLNPLYVSCTQVFAFPRTFAQLEFEVKFKSTKSDYFVQTDTCSLGATSS